MFCFFGREACGVLAPRPGTEPTPPALGGEVLTSRLPGSPYSTLKILTSPQSTGNFFFLMVENFQEGHRKKVLFPQQQSDSLYILCHVAVAGGGFFTQAGWGSALSNFGSTENSNSGFPDGAPCSS